MSVSIIFLGGAGNSTELFQHHPGEHRLSSAEAKALTRSATMVSSTDGSRALSGRHGPMVILTAIGMATGGRVLHHLAHRGGDHRNMIILTGFQVPGTRGATLAAGGRSLHIHGQDVAVNADAVQLELASAHADANQILAWLRDLPKAPDQIYVVHGDMGSADELRKRIKHELGWRARVPEHGSTWPT